MMEEWFFKVLAGFTPGGAGVWTLVVMVGAYLAREWRETRKLSLEDRNARREGYARQVETLMGENRALVNDLHRLHEEYDAGMRALRADHDAYRKQCQVETDQLRSMVVALEGEVEGLKRRVATDAIELVRLRGISL